MQRLPESCRERVMVLWNELELAIRQDRPVVLLAVYRSELVRAEIEAVLRERLHALGHQAIDYRITGPEQADIPRALAEHPEREDAVFFVAGLRADGEDGAFAYRALNYRCEYFATRRLRCVIWLTEIDAQELPRAAPDFWAIRHRALEFVESPDLERHAPLAQKLAWLELSGDQDLRVDTEAKIALREALLSDLPEGQESATARAELSYTLGGLSWVQGTYAQAERRLQEARALYERLENRCRQSWCWNGLGNVYRCWGRTGEAIAAYERAVEMDANYAMPWYNLGLTYADQHRMEKAVAAFQQALALDETWAYPWRGLGNVYRCQGRATEAIKAYKRALDLDARWAKPWNDLGLIYAGQGRIDEAIAAYERAIELDENYASPWNNLGIIYADEGRMEEAITAYGRAIALDARWAVPWNNLGNVYRCLGRTDKAIETYEQATAGASYKVLWHNLGLLYAGQGWLDEAITAYERAIELDGRYAAPWNGLGNVYHSLGLMDKAIAAYERAIDLNTSYAAPWNGLGNVCADLGRVDDAIRAYKHAIDLNMSYVTPWNKLGYLYLTLERGVEAEAVLEHAAELAGPGEYVTWKNLGLLYYRQGQVEAGARHFQEALRRCTEDSLCDRLSRAWLRAVTGESEALDALEAVITEASPSLLADLRGSTHLLATAPIPPPNLESVRETLST